MIYPTTIDLVQCIEANLIEKVSPHLTDKGARSSMATILAMLRHVAVRIPAEGQVLTDMIAQARALLADARDYAAQRDSDDARAAMAGIATAQATGSRAPNAYPDILALSAEAAPLMQGVEDILTFLLSEAAAGISDPQHDEMFGRVKAYLTAQMEAETPLIVPAFLGKGPRR